MNNFFKKERKRAAKKKGGFTLVETLVAIAIFSMSVLGLMSIMASGISDTAYAKQKIEASYLAQEGIEHIRNLRDTSVLYDPSGAQHGWDTFVTSMPTSPSATFYPISDSALSSFTRTTYATSINSDEIKIFSVVTWKQGSGTYNITFAENLFNWVE